MIADLYVKLDRVITHVYTFLKCKVNGTVFGLERTDAELEAERNAAFSRRAKISIITPLYNTPSKYLREMIDSVIAQTYDNWELCIADFSDDPASEVEAIASEYAARDARIVFRRESENLGISENTNTCISMATGEYIAILDHDDVLHPSALYEVMKRIEDHADFIYTDEIKFEENIKFPYAPAFKPDFGREELRVRNYICHFNVYKRTLLDKAGLYDPDYDGSQDHDIVLRLTQKAERIVHIPKILYYWRVHKASVAGNIGAKPYATNAGIRAVMAAYERDGYNFYPASVKNNIPDYRLPAADTTGASIRVVKLNDIDRNIDAILGATTEEYLFLIDSGLEIVTENYLGEMLVYAMQRGVGAVDAMITDTNGRIFSAGLYVREGGSVGARGMGKKSDYPGYESDFTHIRNVSVASGICTMISRSDYRRPGSRMVWTPHVVATGDQDKIMNALNGRILYTDVTGGTDPYYNPNILKFRLEKDNVL